MSSKSVVATSYSTQATLPDQKVGDAERNDPKWYIPTLEYWIKVAFYNNDRSKVIDWMNYASGIIDSKMYLKSILPFTKDSEVNLDEFLAKFPDEFHAGDFITPMKEMSIADYMGLPYNPQVAVNNPDVVLQRDKELKEQMSMVVQQTYINMLNEQQKSGVESKEVPPLDTFYRDYIKDWSDQRAIEGYNTLKLINSELKLDLLRLETFVHWWATEQFFVYRYVDGNKVCKDVVDPRTAYPIINGQRFVEDYDGFMIRDKITMGTFKDRYYDLLSDVDKKLIDNNIYNHMALGINGGMIPPTDLAIRVEHSTLNTLWQGYNSPFLYPNKTIDRTVVIFKTDTPYYLLTRYNELGEIDTVEVDANYVKNPLNGDIELTKEYRQKAMIGYRFGNGMNSFYIKPEFTPVQQYETDTNRCKLPIGGKYGIIPDMPLKPIPMRLIVNQVIDRLYQFVIDKELAKYKSFVEIMPKSLILADDMGTAKEKFLYRTLDGTIIYDDTKVDPQTISQGYRLVENPHVYQYLKTLIELKQLNRKEAEIHAHMNPDRAGDIDTRGGVGNVEANINRAKLGSALMVVMFNAAWLQEHIADLEYSKIAYAQGKIGHFTDSSGLIKMVEIDPEKHFNSRYVLSLENSIIAEQKLAQYKQLAFAAGQNGDTDIAAIAIDSDNRIEIKNALTKISDAKREFEQNMQTQQVQLQQQAKQIDTDLATKELELKGSIAKYHEDNENYRTQLKLSNTGVTQADPDASYNNVQNLMIEIEKLKIERERINATLKQSADANSIARAKMANDMKIARTNKN